VKAPELDQTSLRQPAATVANAIARVQFETLLIRAAPLLHGTPEAIAGRRLHDFRVALRRLRSTLRAWQEPLGGVPRGKPRRRLKKLSRLGGVIRDLELKIKTLELQRDELGPEAAAATTSLTVVLSHERSRLQQKFRRRLGKRLASMAAKLQSGLVTPAYGNRAATAEVLRELARNHGGTIIRAFSAVSTEDDVAAAHALRITAKRLRYLLEPFEPALESVAPAVAQLTRLQDVFGALHDAQVLRSSVREAAPQTPFLEKIEETAETGVRARFSEAQILLCRRAKRDLQRLIATVVREVTSRPDLTAPVVSY
jgi:CHAD domain-containing protein